MSKSLPPESYWIMTWGFEHPVFVGRVEWENGVSRLMRAWPRSPRPGVFGSSPVSMFDETITMCAHFAIDQVACYYADTHKLYTAPVSAFVDVPRTNTPNTGVQRWLPAQHWTVTHGGDPNQYGRPYRAWLVTIENKQVTRQPFNEITRKVIDGEPSVDEQSEVRLVHARLPVLCVE